MLVDIALGFLLYVCSMIAFLYYTWFVEKSEGFQSGSGSGSGEPTIPPGGNDSKTSLSPAAAMNTNNELIVQNTNIQPVKQEVARENWSKMTSESCYRKDLGEELKRTGNYLQRTNNYIRSNPDDCSAPNHEFIGTFYDISKGIGQTPPSGGNMPPSTLCE